MEAKFINPAELWQDYELIDCGGFEKLERFGDYVLARPEPQALWNKSMSDEEWEERCQAYFKRTKADNFDRGEWLTRPAMPDNWKIGHNCNGKRLSLRLALTSFKHVGLFPEQAANWSFIAESIEKLKEKKDDINVLNLFAYTGGATIAAASAGANVTHVDSVKQVVTWSKENMEDSGLDGVRWIVEDARKFVTREVKRGKKYNGIILDPPAYGRGSDGEKWVLEEDIYALLTDCAKLLDDNGFVVFNLYSMGLSALLAKGLLSQIFGVKDIDFGELYFCDNFDKTLPLGVYARFVR